MRISVRAAAVRNNADWCAAMCRSHGIASTFGESAWCSARRSPRYYPDAVTLRPDAVPADFLPGIDKEASSIKDSFAALDLTPDGYAELFTARWIHRPADLSAPRPPALRTTRVSTAAQLREWQAAWNGGDAAEVFRPALLDDPAVHVAALHDGRHLAGGFVLFRSAGVVGLSNVFTTGDGHATDVWSSAVTHFPGLPLVGYERGDDLEVAFASGFVALGTLRVWLHEGPARPTS